MLVLRDLDAARGSDVFSVDPTDDDEERPNGEPYLSAFFGTDQVSAAKVMMHDGAFQAVLHSIKRKARVNDGGKLRPWPVIGRERMSRDNAYTRQYLETFTVAPTWKSTRCGLCRNCDSHIDGLSTSDCLAPTYLPTGPLRLQPRDLGEPRGESFNKRWDDARFSVDHRMMALIHPQAGYVKNWADPVYGLRISPPTTARHAAFVFSDIYRLRAYSGQNSAPHNHFIDGGAGFVASLMEDEGTWLAYAKSVGHHLPISNVEAGRSYARVDFDATEPPRPMDTDDYLSLHSLRKPWHRRAFALQTIGVVTHTNPADLLVDRTTRFCQVLIELMQVTEPIFDCLESGVPTAFAHADVLDGVFPPGEYPFDCHGDNRRAALAKELDKRDLPRTAFVSACRPYPGAAPFGSLAPDFGLPVRRADSNCPHVYQLRLRTFDSRTPSPQHYDPLTISFAISTQSHSTLKRVMLTLPQYGAFHGTHLPMSLTRRLLHKVSVNPLRGFLNLGDQKLSSTLRVRKLHVGERKWLTETDLSATASRAIFEPDRRRSHEWEALAWTANVTGYILYDGVNPLNGHHQPLDEVFKAGGEDTCDIMDAETQDDEFRVGGYNMDELRGVWGV